jgi:hypothetical protein
MLGPDAERQKLPAGWGSAFRSRAGWMRACAKDRIAGRPSSSPSMKFISGEPMKLATKRFAGRS